jgi:co-chaperonin GroES (HSP10)
MKEGGIREIIDVKVGDVVYFTKYSPTEVKVGDKEFYLIDFDDVLATEVETRE